MERIAVVDYAMGNLRSVAKALEHVTGPRQSVIVTSDTRVIQDAGRIVFPGQGAIRDCMAELKNHGLYDAVLEAASQKPFLGICMGLQALMEESEECPDTPGLGILKGGVKRLPGDAVDSASGERLKIPHMGWNRVRIAMQHPIWKGITDGERFYFVHSYYVAPSDRSVVAGTTEYGVEFTSVAAHANLFAVQFHPEKSQRAGLALLKNFLEWNP